MIRQSRHLFPADLKFEVRRRMSGETEFNEGVLQ